MKTAQTIPLRDQEDGGAFARGISRKRALESPGCDPRFVPQRQQTACDHPCDRSQKAKTFPALDRQTVRAASQTSPSWSPAWCARNAAKDRGYLVLIAATMAQLGCDLLGHVARGAGQRIERNDPHWIGSPWSVGTTAHSHKRRGHRARRRSARGRRPSSWRRRPT